MQTIVQSNPKQDQKNKKKWKNNPVIQEIERVYGTISNDKEFMTQKEINELFADYPSLALLLDMKK